MVYFAVAKKRSNNVVRLLNYAKIRHTRKKYIPYRARSFVTYKFVLVNFFPTCANVLNILKVLNFISLFWKIYILLF